MDAWVDVVGRVKDKGWILEPTKLGVGGVHLDGNAKPCKVDLRGFPLWSSG